MLANHQRCKSQSGSSSVASWLPFGTGGPLKRSFTPVKSPKTESIIDISPF